VDTSVDLDNSILGKEDVRRGVGIHKKPARNKGTLSKNKLSG
jgi:hypothetical protein